MSFTLSYLGHLTDEITQLLSHLDENHDWEKAENSLYESGLIFSKKSNKRITAEIKRRFISSDDTLPELDQIVKVAKSNMNSISKAEIYYVYLYNLDSLVSKMVNFIGEIFDHSKENPIITRKDIKYLFLRYLEQNKKEITEKSIENWIGRFLSLLKEIKFLLPQSNHTYIMNLGGITVETWTFFILHSYFKGYNILKGRVIDAFQLRDEHISQLIKRSKKKNWTNNNLKLIDNKDKYIEIHTSYSNLEEWLRDFT